MPIITVATSKGGAGKTTVARLLLGRAAQAGMKTAALDADLNHSLSDWITGFSKYPITLRTEVDEAKIVPTITELSEDHSFVLVDTAGAAAQATVFAIGCADLVIVPMQLSSSDLVEAVKTMNLVKSAAQMMRREIPARVLLTSFRPRTNIAEHIENEIGATGLPQMNVRIQDSVVFKEMTFSGVVPATGFAGFQVNQLFDEAMDLAGDDEALEQKAS